MAFGFGKRDGRIGPVTVRDVVGQLFNAPNTAAGLTYGALGHAAGQVGYGLGMTERRPRIVRGSGKTEFVNNPLGGVGAITMGDTTTVFDDPYDAKDYEKDWKGIEAKEGHTVWEHERQHMMQGRQLGPLYLPSNLLGGATALLRDGDWHGESNWNERGPKSNPARPWAPRRPR